MYFCLGRLFNPNKQCIDVDTKLFKGCVPAGLFHSIPHSATRLFFGFLLRVHAHLLFLGTDRYAASSGYSLVALVHMVLSLHFY